MLADMSAGVLCWPMAESAALRSPSQALLERAKLGVDMARVGSFVTSTQNVREHPTVVVCEYQVLRDGAGQPTLIHLATMGSSSRASGPKTSQAFQLGEQQAPELVELLEQAFPAIRAGKRD